MLGREAAKAAKERKMKPYHYPAQTIFQVPEPCLKPEMLTSVAEKIQRQMDKLSEQFNHDCRIKWTGALKSEFFPDPQTNEHFCRITTQFIITKDGYNWDGPENPSIEEQMEKPDFCTKSDYWKKI